MVAGGFISRASTLRDEHTLRLYDVVVKNTFIDLEEHDDDLQRGESRRSNSVPRTWKPGTLGLPLSSSELPSDASVSSSTTAASRGEDASDVGQESDLTEANDPFHFTIDSMAWQPTGPSMVPRATTGLMATRLNREAAAFLPPNMGRPVREATVPRLNAQAPAFEPSQHPTHVQQGFQSQRQEVSDAIAAATLALQGSQVVSDVKVTPGSGNAVSIDGEVVGTGAQVSFTMKEALQSAKDALLTFAASSQNTYVMGYEQTPFKDWVEHGSPMTCGFSATIGIVPAEHQDTACWDTYQKGFCPRPATCRWCHPEDWDMSNVCFTLKSISGMTW